MNSYILASAEMSPPQSATAPLRFSVVAEKIYAESEIPDLFDSVVNQLEELARLDSLIPGRAIKSLENLIEVIRANSKDYSSAAANHSVLRTFLKSTFVAALKKVPAVDVIVEGLEKTCEELGVKSSELPAKLANETLSQLNEIMPWGGQGKSILEDFDSDYSFGQPLRIENAAEESVE